MPGTTPQTPDSVGFVFVDDLTKPTAILAVTESNGHVHSLPTVAMRPFQAPREAANAHLAKILPPATGGVLKTSTTGPVHRGQPPATSTQAGEEVASQIGAWPTSSEAQLHVFYVQLADGLTLDDAAACLANAQVLPLATTTDATWAPDHIGPLLAARSALISKATKPRWSGHRTFGSLTFAPLSEADLPDFTELWSHADVTRNLGHRPLSPAQAKLYVHGRLKDAAGGSYIPVVCREAGRFVGEGRITLSPRWSCVGPTGLWDAKVGFAVPPHEQGKGYGSAIMSELVSICFDDLGVEAIRATVFDRSKASASVMTKIGFEHCGTNPQSFTDIDGSSIDDLQMVFTKERYRTLTRSGDARR